MVAPRIDTLLEIKDHIAAYTALVSGQFENEIKRLQAIKVDAESRLKQANALDTFDKVKADVDAYKERKLQEIEDAQQALKDFEASLKAREAQIEVNMKNYYDERSAHLAAVEAHSQRVVEDLTTISDVKKEAEKSAEKAAAAWASVTQRENNVTQREAEVERKLSVLKSI